MSKGQCSKVGRQQGQPVGCAVSYLFAKEDQQVLQVQKVQRGQGGAFRHPERRKTLYVGLSEIMRTESKDLSTAEV